MKLVICICSRGTTTVLEPFMGSGTTGLACLRTGRNFIGIERDVAHYETACERIQASEESKQPLQMEFKTCVQ